jgi:beta-galactosidase
VFREVVAFGETLSRLAETDAGAVEAEVAIGWDAASWWALQSPSMPSDRLDYQAAVTAAHRALWRAGFGVDFVTLNGELAGEESLHYLVSDAVADRVREYVAAGGHLVVTYLSGVADEYGRVRTGGYPGAFRDLLGIRVEEFHPLAPGESAPLAADVGPVTPPVAAAVGGIWAETVRLAGARPVATYAAGPLVGQPAVTRHAYGAGMAWYVSTRLDDASHQRMLAYAAQAAGVAPVCPAAPAGVEAVRRRSGERSWLFLLNHTDGALDVPASGVDLVSGARVATAVTVPARGFAVVREEP